MRPAEPLPFVVYTPESKLKHPASGSRDGARPVGLAGAGLAADGARYYCAVSPVVFGHFLGIFWAFVPPILMAVGFTYAINADIINVGETELPYAAHVMFSAVLWQTWRQG